MVGGGGTCLQLVTSKTCSKIWLRRNITFSLLIIDGEQDSSRCPLSQQFVKGRGTESFMERMLQSCHFWLALCKMGNHHGKHGLVNTQATLSPVPLGMNHFYFLSFPANGMCCFGNCVSSPIQLLSYHWLCQVDTSIVEIYADWCPLSVDRILSKRINYNILCTALVLR